MRLFKAIGGVDSCTCISFIVDNFKIRKQFEFFFLKRNRTIRYFSCKYYKPSRRAYNVYSDGRISWPCSFTYNVSLVLVFSFFFPSTRALLVYIHVNKIIRIYALSKKKKIIRIFYNKVLIILILLYTILRWKFELNFVNIF